MGCEGGLGVRSLTSWVRRSRRSLLGEAGAGAAGVDEVAGLARAAFGGGVVAEEEGADAVGAFAGEGEAGDDELLLAEAFGLEPVGGAGAAVGCVGALGDDAFGVELRRRGGRRFRRCRGCLRRGGGVRRLGCGWEEMGEELLAFAEGEVAGVVAVEVEEVEDEVGEGVGVGVLEGGLKEGEAGVAVGGEDDDFAVEGAVVRGELGDGGGDGGHAVGPVEALAGKKRTAELAARRTCGPGCGSRRA